MKVILLDEIKGKGGEGDVVEVAQGLSLYTHLTLPTKRIV